jgi:uncharacterized coiled-coil protein SlyX
MAGNHPPTNNGQSSEQIDRLLERMDIITRNMTDSRSTSVNSPPTGDKLTFTLSQIASGFFAIIAVGGAVLGAWNNINGQVMSQKVSTDLILEQIKKDITELKESNKLNQAKTDTEATHTQESITNLSHRVDELDNSVSQMYNRTRMKDK